jgi:hypothetical protein
MTSDKSAINFSFSTLDMARPELIIAASPEFISVAFHLAFPLKILIRSYARSFIAAFA